MTCKNCNTGLLDDQRFCSNCGELSHTKRLKVKSIIGMFFSDFFSYDNKFIKTFRVLTTHPEVVIDSYVNGIRKTYVNVISYLGLSITLIGIQFFVLQRFFPELLQVDDLVTKNALKVNNDVFDINTFMGLFYEYQGLLSILLLPFYSLASKLLFFDSKKYNLAEHFVINIYTNSHFFMLWFVITLMTLPLGINYNLLSQLAIIPMLAYMTYTFKRLYKIKTFDALARIILYYILVFVVMIILFILIGIGFGIYLALTGKLTPTTV